MLVLVMAAADVNQHPPILYQTSDDLTAFHRHSIHTIHTLVDLQRKMGLRGPDRRPGSGSVQTPFLFTRPAKDRLGQESVAPAVHPRCASHSRRRNLAPPARKQTGVNAVGKETKPVVRVPVVWVVPVPIGATSVVMVVVERTTTQHTTRQPIPAKPARKPEFAFYGLLDSICDWVALIQPPSRRPISVTARLACWY